MINVKLCMGAKNKEAPRTFYRCGDSFGRVVTDYDHGSPSGRHWNWPAKYFFAASLAGVTAVTALLASRVTSRRVMV